jgi:PUB domain
MELRTAEADVQSLVEFYATHHLRDRLHSYSSSKADEVASELWPLLEEFQTRLLALPPRIEAFRLRAQQADPITKQSRYGPQTLQRVQAMIQLYDNLYHDEYQTLLLQQPNDDEQNLFTRVQHAAELERLQKDKEEQQRLKEEEEQRLQKEREEAEQRLERASVETQPTPTALHVPARDAQDAAEERRRQQDRAWIQSIPHRKTLRGVQEQFRRWLDALPEDHRSTSMRALHRLFQQIVQHPEEANFRRIRRDHAQFQQDIGQFPGGSELLIAAGFQLGTMDRVPCFLSIEPNVEVDFDEWSQWFDLLKGTLDLIEQEMPAIRGK